MFIVLSNRQLKDLTRKSPDEQNLSTIYLQKYPNMRMIFNLLQSNIFLILEAVCTLGVRIVTRRDLFNLEKNYNNPNLEQKLNCLKDHLLSPVAFTEDQHNKCKRNFAHFKSEIKSMWTKSHNKEDVFLNNNHLWLDGRFEIPVSRRRNYFILFLFNYIILFIQHQLL